MSLPSLPSLPMQHLSDEAVAAFADGVLGATARGRATRHIAHCAECAYAVAEQRAAVWALRAAPAPDLPNGLLDRLRAVPSTTPLNQQPVAVSPDGAAVFPAYGTDATTVHTAGAAMVGDLQLPDPPPHPTSRRHGTFGLLTAAAAVVTLGTVSAGVASASGDRQAPSAPQPSRVSPAVYRTPLPAGSPYSLLVGAGVVPQRSGR